MPGLGPVIHGMKTGLSLGFPVSIINQGRQSGQVSDTGLGPGASLKPSNASETASLMASRLLHLARESVNFALWGTAAGSPWSSHWALTGCTAPSSPVPLFSACPGRKGCLVGVRHAHPALDSLQGAEAGRVFQGRGRELQTLCFAPNIPNQHPSLYVPVQV